MIRFLEKLRTLPESKKIMIFFVVMGIAALVAGFVGMRFIMADFNRGKDSIKSVEFPKIDLPQIPQQNNPNQ